MWSLLNRTVVSVWISASLIILCKMGHKPEDEMCQKLHISTVYCIEPSSHAIYFQWKALPDYYSGAKATQPL